MERHTMERHTMERQGVEDADMLAAQGPSAGGAPMRLPGPIETITQSFDMDTMECLRNFDVLGNNRIGEALYKLIMSEESEVELVRTEDLADFLWVVLGKAMKQELTQSEKEEAETKTAAAEARADAAEAAACAEKQRADTAVAAMAAGMTAIAAAEARADAAEAAAGMAALSAPPEPESEPELPPEPAAEAQPEPEPAKPSPEQIVERIQELFLDNQNLESGAPGKDGRNSAQGTGKFGDKRRFETMLGGMKQKTIGDILAKGVQAVTQLDPMHQENLCLLFDDRVCANIMATGTTIKTIHTEQAHVRDVMCAEVTDAISKIRTEPSACLEAMNHLQQEMLRVGIGSPHPRSQQ